MPELTSLYLSRVAVGTGIGSYVAPTAAAELAFAATRSFDGRLVGSGALIKIGNEDLNFGGSSPDFTGRVEIAGGTLNLIWATGSNEAPLRNAQYFLTTAPGVLAVTVNDAYDPVTDLNKRTFTAPIVGTGGFVKRGEGYLKLAPGVVVGQTPYTGTTTVQAGWLEMAALAATVARFSPLACPMPMSAEPALLMIIRTSAKSVLMRPGLVMRSDMPATPLYRTSSACAKASITVSRASTIDSSRSFGTTMRVSTFSFSFAIPASA